MTETLPVSAAQIRAARALLGWSQQALIERASVSRRTLTAIETGDAKVSVESVTAVVEAILDAGIVFIGSGADEGVKRR